MTTMTVESRHEAVPGAGRTAVHGASHRARRPDIEEEWTRLMLGWIAPARREEIRQGLLLWARERLPEEYVRMVRCRTLLHALGELPTSAANVFLLPLPRLLEAMPQAEGLALELALLRTLNGWY